MDQNRWEEISRIYQATLEVAEEERLQYLQNECAGDLELRSEVESLLIRHEHAGDFLGKPAMEVVAQEIKNGTNNLIGKNFGAYKILELLGHGGMGEVYRVRDTHLQRNDAMKVLLPELAENQDFLRRFQREARAAAGLNHPNIATVYEVNENEGVHFIVMELVEGQTLSEQLRKGPLGLKEVLDIGFQVASALEAAHERGIIHRDIKPANLMRTPGGVVKVLDFGLAKIMPLTGQALEETAGTATHSFPGMVLGTARYMSPEQILGQPVDPRTDIFSLGVVLFELATGHSPFPGETSDAIFEAILHLPPAWPSQAKRKVPAGLQKLINHSLEKFREMRYRNVSVLKAELEQLKSEFFPAQPGAAKVSWTGKIKGLRRRFMFAVGVPLLLCSASVVYLLRPELPPPRLENPVQLTFDGRPWKFDLRSAESALFFGEVIDGRYRIMRIPANGGHSIQLAVESPIPKTEPLLMDVSQDGQTLLLKMRPNEYPYPGFLYTMDLSSGEMRRTLDTPVDVGLWFPDGKQLLYSLNRMIFTCDLNGENRRQLVSAPVNREITPLFISPDGKRFRFITIRDFRGLFEDMWELGTDGPYALIKLTRQLRPKVDAVPTYFYGYKSGLWTPDLKYSVFAGGDGIGSIQLWAIQEKPTLFHKRPSQAVQLTNSALQTWMPTFSPDGRRLFILGRTERVEMMKLDRALGQWKPFMPGLSAGFLEFSKDKQRIIYTTYPKGELWSSRVDGSERLKLVSSPPLAVAEPHWSPDGSQIAFVGFGIGGPKIFIIPSRGGTPKPFIENITGQSVLLFSWSPDGTKIVFGNSIFASPPEAGRRIFIYDQATRQTTLVKGSKELEIAQANWSPNGKFLLANSAKKIMTFDLETQKWRTVYEGVYSCPRFSQDGKSAYFFRFHEKDICRLNLASRKMEIIHDMKNIPTFVIEGGPWLGFSSEDEPVVLHDASTAEIFAYDWVAP
jgi:eukaryotic-like serine/threonine-protein kinase